MAEDTPVDGGENDTTKSSMTRWKYIGTLLALVMIISLPTLILGAALGTLTLSGISQAWFGLYFLVTMMAATWAFGRETLEAVQKARGRSSE